MNNVNLMRMSHCNQYCLFTFFLNLVPKDNPYENARILGKRIMHLQFKTHVNILFILKNDKMIFISNTYKYSTISADLSILLVLF